MRTRTATRGIGHGRGAGFVQFPPGVQTALESHRKLGLAGVADRISHRKVGTGARVQVDDLVDCGAREVGIPSDGLRSLVGNDQLPVDVGEDVLVGGGPTRANVEGSRGAGVGRIRGNRNLSG